MPEIELSIDQLKLISTINEHKSAYWEVTHKIESGNLVIYISSNTTPPFLPPRQIATVIYSQAKQYLLLHFFGVGEKRLLQSILKDYQSLPVYLV
jgi:hypothetical protein